jgi:predicted RNA-binding protein YlqC (UPF0109 family)
MSEVEKDQVFVEYVVKALVEKPEKVVIKRSIDDRGVLLELTVDPEDMGKIIGKAGATAKSIRTLLRVLGARDELRYNLKISEPEGSEFSARPKSDSDDSESSEEPKPAEDEFAQVDSKAAEIKAKAREGIEDLDTDI